jgi:photosystem II stability/assembly factor-like uncharacterized protein
MTDDPIALLALANPVTEPVTPAPVAEVLARVDLDAPRRGAFSAPARRSRALGFVMPSLAVGVTLAVAAAAIVLIHSPARTATTRPAASGTPTTPTTPLVAGEGMRGTVVATAASFPTPTDGVVSFLQYPGTRGQEHGDESGWLATTRDGGSHWDVRHVGYDVGEPVFANARDGWGAGMTAAYRSAYYVTHDAGRTWAPVHLPDGERPYTTAMAVAGGAAWAVGFKCPTRESCRTSVLRGDASQSTLAPVAAQVGPDPTSQIIAAGSATTAYTTARVHDGAVVQSFATHDAGHHWSPIPSACTYPEVLAAVGDGAVWQLCLHDRVAASGDGGHHWHVHRSTVGAIEELVPSSGTTAWAVTDRGDLVRTTDGGRTWHVVVHPDANAEPAGLAPALGVLDPAHPSIAYSVPAGARSQLMVSRVSGATTSSSLIKLPPGRR